MVNINNQETGAGDFIVGAFLPGLDAQKRPQKCFPWTVMSILNFLWGFSMPDVCRHFLTERVLVQLVIHQANDKLG